MDEIRFENLTREELMMAVRLSGRVPEDRECAGLRIQRLECEAVSILESIGKLKAHMANSCLSYEARIGASLAKAAMEYRYIESMDHIKALTERYFTNKLEG